MDLKAAIDIGTNSTRLLIAAVHPDGRVEPLVYDERLTKLGDGLSAEGDLDDAAMARVIAALVEYQAQIAARHVEVVHILATSATRDARNKDVFLKKITATTQWPCRVLSGEEEARLSFLGVLSDLTLPSDSLVCDVGGGSSEFVFAGPTKIHDAASINTGSGRLTRRFFRNDPPRKNELIQCTEHVWDQLKMNFPEHPPVLDIIAVGGTAATLALMASGTAVSHPYKAHHYRLSYSGIDRLILDLSEKSIAQRRTIIGLHPDRADVILGGALIFAEILDYFNCDSLLVSLRDLMFGVMVE